MKSAVPDIFQQVDFFASHAYPASGIGYGFNAPYDQAAPGNKLNKEYSIKKLTLDRIGLTYYRQELQHIGRSLPVLITETGWALNPGGGEPQCTEQNKADWTVVSREYLEALCCH